MDWQDWLDCQDWCTCRHCRTSRYMDKRDRETVSSGGFIGMHPTPSKLVMPPIKLWLIGLLFIASGVFLRVPPFPLPFFLSWFAPTTFSTNDLLDGLVFVIASCFLHRANFPRGINALVFLCFCLKLIGHGAHVVANSVDQLHGHDLRQELGKHIFWMHERFAHNCAYFGEFGLIALYIYQYAPIKYEDLDLGLEMPGFILAAVHGLTAGVVAVGTATTHALFPIYFVIIGIVLKRQRTLRSSILVYAYMFSGFSLFFVITWFVMHGYHMPTFDTVNNVYKK